MTPDQITQLIITVAGLAAIAPGWLLSTHLYFGARWPILAVLLIVLVTGLLATLGFYVPFLVDNGKEVKPLETLIDLLIYSVAPLGLIALIAYVLDHIHERPTMVLIACSACFAISALPVAYYFLAEQMHEKYQIVVIQAVP